MNTIHATIRAQQRGIPPIIVDLLVRFGSSAHDNSGAEILYFDKRAKKNVNAYAGGLIGKFNEHLDTYAVIADGKIITLGARVKPVNNR